MRLLLDEVHNQKLSTMTFLSDVKPVVDRFRALRDKRDDIMNKSTSLSFAHETTWLPLGAAQLSATLVADELGQYDELLEEAKQQQAPHDEILLSLKVRSVRYDTRFIGRNFGPSGFQRTFNVAEGCCRSSWHRHTPFTPISSVRPVSRNPLRVQRGDEGTPVPPHSCLQNVSSCSTAGSTPCPCFEGRYQGSVSVRGRGCYY